MKYLKLIILPFVGLMNASSPNDLRIEKMYELPGKSYGRKMSYRIEEEVFQMHIENISNPDVKFVIDISVEPNSESALQFRRLLEAVHVFAISSLSEIKLPFRQIEFQWSKSLCNFSLEGINTKNEPLNLVEALSILSNFVEDFHNTKDSTDLFIPVKPKLNGTCPDSVQTAFMAAHWIKNHPELFKRLIPLIKLEPYSEILLSIVDKTLIQPRDDGLVHILDSEPKRLDFVKFVILTIVIDDNSITIPMEYARLSCGDGYDPNTNSLIGYRC